jgi:5-hydroxyisourate hydrolase-like protein (transthyretin family)
MTKDETMRRLRYSLLLVPLLLAGCGKQESVKVYPVSGQVIYNGQPAAGVKVFLFPTSAPMVPRIPSNPRGETDNDGRFTLTTYTSGDGAAEGGYQVLLLWPDGSDGEEATGDRLLGWYDVVNSKLTAQIQSGSNTLPTFNLPRKTQPPEAVQGIPGRN